MNLSESPVNNWDELIHLSYEDFITRILAKPQLDINFQNPAGETALHLCCQYGYLDKFYALVYMGADYKIKNNFGDTILHYAAFYSRDFVLTQEIAKKYIDPLEKNDKGLSSIDICSSLQDRIFFFNWAQLHKIKLPLTELSINRDSHLKDIEHLEVASEALRRDTESI